eukprot:93892-Prymnesium_polylepis.1
MAAAPSRAPWLLCALLTLPEIVTGTSGNCQAGGAGYAYAFDGLKGTTISMQWQTEPLSQLTIEYWLNVLDVHVTQQPVFAYSAFSSAGRYSQGGAQYENANELVLLHAPGFARFFRATSRSPDFALPAPYARAGSWVHVAAVWAANASDNHPHGQLALYLDGVLVANDTICSFGACDMGMPIQPMGFVHLGQEADSPSGDFDEFQALTGMVDE